MLTLNEAYNQLGILIDQGVDLDTPITTRGHSPTGLEDNIEIRATRSASGPKIHFGMSKADRDRQIANGIAIPSPTNQIESTTTVNYITIKPFSTVDYVYGQDVSTASPAFLIGALNRVNNEIKDLQAVEATSTKIASMIEDLTSMKAKIVAALDAAK